MASSIFKSLTISIKYPLLLIILSEELIERTKVCLLAPCTLLSIIKLHATSQTFNKSPTRRVSSDFRYDRSNPLEISLIASSNFSDRLAEDAEFEDINCLAANTKDASVAIFTIVSML
ncbi:hypothetical protein A4G21_11930 [Brucella intermedia]|nr:hypothetical protein A4G21_11930 [Brucella intermedia]